MRNFSGNLRLELDSSASCDVHLERSYLVRWNRHILKISSSDSNFQIDFSKQLVGWVKSEGYSLLDANLYPKPAVATNLVGPSFFGVHWPYANDL